MANVKASFKMNLVYGLIVLVPAAVIALLVVQVVGALGKLGQHLGLQSIWSVLLVVLLGLAGLVVACYLIGAAVRTRLGAWSFDKLEARVFKQIPGYQLVKNLLTGFAEKRSTYPAALVRLQENGAAALAVVMEQHPDGKSTVFVPLAPIVSLGSVYVVDNDRITMLKANALDLVGCVSQWGVGSGEMLAKGLRAPAETPGPHIS